MDERREVIERLKALDLDGDLDAFARLSLICGAIERASMIWNHAACYDLRTHLVRLLEGAGAVDEDAYLKLPTDADGETIHIGDELCGYGWPNGGVYCQATDGHLILVGTKSDGYRDWLLWMPRECIHVKPKPTIEDVLREFQAKTVNWCFRVDLHNLGDGPREKAALVEEYAEKLKELMDE